MMQEQREEKIRELVGSLYEQVNFLTIRKSVKNLLEQDQELVEEFVKQYSIIVIYFLNILDSELTGRLLQKLTNHSILYIIEEELRTILIRIIASDDVDFETLTELSSFLDLIDNPAEQSAVDESSAKILDLLVQHRKDDSHGQFAYLEQIPPSRRESIVRFLLNRNVHVSLALLVYGNDDILKEILDTIAFHQARNLRYIPPEIYIRRFQKNYNLYLNEKVSKNLPERVGEILQGMDQIHNRYGSFLEEIGKEPHSKRSRHDRQKALDLAYELIQNTDQPGVRTMILQELIRKGALSSKEVQLLESMQ